MTGLIAPAPPSDAPSAQVVADGWFPPVKLAAVRDALRLGDGMVTTARLTAAIEGGMVHAFRELSNWRSARAGEGADSLSAVTELTLNNRNYAELLWERVVRHFAGAQLFEQYRDVSATEASNDRAEDKAETASDQRRLALAAVADLLSVGIEEPPQPKRIERPVERNRVELI